MSLYNGPPRGGARGGKDQFSWDSVKSDKDREFYLGHSVKASVGRWQKGKDLFWYTREKQGDGNAAVQSELATVKAREEELMLEALGLKPKAVKARVDPQLDQMEMKKLLEGSGDGEEEGGADRDEADQIKGIGYRSGQVTGAGDAGREIMAGVGMARQPPPTAPTAGIKPPSNQLPPPPPTLSEKQLKKLRRAQKREQKKAKRKAKKMKKEKRKDLKRQKMAELAVPDAQPPRKRARHDSSTESSSSSDASAADSPEPQAAGGTSDAQRAGRSGPAHGRQTIDAAAASHGAARESGRDAGNVHRRQVEQERTRHYQQRGRERSRERRPRSPVEPRARRHRSPSPSPSGRRR